MSVDNFRVYDIRMLPAQEIKTIYDAFIFHYKIQHATFGIVYQFHRLSQKPSKIRNFTLGELHTAFLS